MPNYFHQQPNGLLTPPEYRNRYNASGCGQYSGQQGAGKRHEQIFFEGAEAYGHNYAAPGAPMMYQPPAMNYSGMPTAPPPGLGHPGNAFGPIAAPILPPLAMPDRTVDAQESRREQQERRRSQQAPAKEEKAVGGVSAVLDYQLPEMTQYISNMAQEMYALCSSPHLCVADIDIVRSVMPGNPVSPAFRKFVSGLLSSTRLPSSTILLGMNYLAKRMSLLNGAGAFKASDGQVWRMLTIALLLGSKFLDDNTFQNRSWSEVSGIPVAEINSLELEWLEAIDWKLHVNLDTSEDYHAWLTSWANWRDAKERENAATLERLAPLDTSVQRNQRKSFSPSRYSSYMQAGNHRRPHSNYHAQSAPAYDQSAWYGSANDMSSPSAPETGPNTPEYLNLPGAGLPAADWFNYGSLYAGRQRSAAYTSAQPYQQNFYNPYSQNIWGGHGAGCNCSYCARSNESYWMAPNYGQQTVVG